jgi:uncharacterized membrane protein
MEKIKRVLKRFLAFYLLLGVAIGGFYALRQFMIRVSPAPAAPSVIEDPLSSR